MSQQSESVVLLLGGLVSIKTPQFIGIVAGCCVFTVTILVVFALLYASGALKSFTNDSSSNNSKKDKASDDKTKTSVRDERFVDALFQYPQLYEELLLAAKQLPLKPDPPVLTGPNIEMKQLTRDTVESVVQVSDGSALFGGSAYDPASLWLWISDVFVAAELNSKDENSSSNETVNDPASLQNKDVKLLWPSSSMELFSAFYGIDTLNSNVTCLARNHFFDKDSATHLVITDKVMTVPVGMVSLTNNNPSYLSIQISRLWITPSYHKMKRGHEALLLLLQWLFKSGYRRVVIEVDCRHFVLKKFVERCGFRQEAVLRKHKVMYERSADTLLYVLLNSEWNEAEIKLKKYLGISLAPKKTQVGSLFPSSTGEKEHSQ